MAKISELISKFIISLYNGKMEGVVENILFDPKTNRAKYFIVYNTNTDTKILLHISNIYSIGSGAVTIRNSSALTLCDNLELETKKLCTPINSNVFKVSGDTLGIIVDAEMDEKYYLTSLTLNNQQTIDKNMIASYNNHTVLVYDDNKKINLSIFYDKKKVPQKTTTPRLVSILESKEDKSEMEVVDKPTLTPTQLPNRAISNYNFLINRKVKKNIMSFEGDILIKQNTKINTNVVNLARNNGKLNELTKFSS